MTSHTIALIANIALAISVVIGLIFGIVQVKTAARDRRERFTLEALRILVSKPRHFSLRFSQNRTCTSQRIRLPIS